MAPNTADNQLLIILSLVCKFCINLVHVAMPNQCSKRLFVNRNTLGRRINAETVRHTVIFFYTKWLLSMPGTVNLCLERAGQVLGHPLPHKLGICLLVWKLINIYIYEYVYYWDKYLFRNVCLHIQHHRYKRTGSLDLHMWRHSYKDHLHIRQYLGN